MRKDLHNCMRLLRLISWRSVPFCITTLLISLRNFAITYLTAWIGANIINECINGNGIQLGKSFFIFLAVLVGFILADSFARTAYEQIVHRIFIFLRERIMKAVLFAPLPSLERFGTRGDLATRQNQDVDQAVGAFRSVLTPLMFILSGISATVMVASIYWPFVFLLYAVGIVSLWLQKIISEKQRKFEKQTRQATASMLSNVMQSYGNLREMRASGLSEYSGRLFAGCSGRYLTAGQGAARMAGAGGLLSGVGYIVSNVGILIVELLLLSSGKLSAADVIYLQTMSATVLMMFTALRSSTESFHMAMVGVERSLELLELPVEEDLWEGRGEFVLSENADFVSADELICRFSDGKTLRYHLHIPFSEGRIFALCGESGTGKTTLFRLLLGLCPYESGSLRLMGQEVRDVSLKSLRSGVTYCTQDTPITEGSIRDILSYGNAGVCEEQLQRVLHTVCAEDWVAALPDGLETNIGENAAGISGGQRQMLALANALLRNTPLYLMDEVFAGIDENRQPEIMRRLREAYPDARFLIITHNERIMELCDAKIPVNASA